MSVARETPAGDRYHAPTRCSYSDSFELEELSVSTGLLQGRSQPIECSARARSRRLLCAHGRPSSGQFGGSALRVAIVDRRAP